MDDEPTPDPLPAGYHFIEYFAASGTAFGYAIEEHVHTEQTPFQKLDVYRTRKHGHLMALDGMVMLTEGDEFLYHEALAHVPLGAHTNPKSVLVIGGGDGGTVRECLKHPSVERVELVEIDVRVVDAARQYFPGCAGCLDDPRVVLNLGDGVARAAELAMLPADDPGRPDVILVDSTDPEGPAVALFEAPFFRDLAQALAPNGLVAMQAGPAHFAREEVVGAHRLATEAFGRAQVYTAPVMGYPGGLWCFVLADKTERDLTVPTGKKVHRGRWYSRNTHMTAFLLPPFLEDDLGQKTGP